MGSSNGPGVKILETYEFCQVCYANLVKRTYCKNNYRPLCIECSTLVTKITVPVLDKGCNLTYDGRGSMITKTRNRTPEEVDKYIKRHQARKPKGEVKC